MKGTLTPWTKFPRAFGDLEFEFPRWMNRIFEDGPVAGEFKFVPEANVTETEKGVEVTLEVPGMKGEEIKLEVRDQALIVAGEKREEKEEKGKTFHRIERRAGMFRRVIPLPVAVDETKAEAVITDGVLKVALPKTMAAAPKTIPIKA
jgi:HSP20 family protein